ncbi:hypothetical protein [Microvirga splendida]|uniref:Uncharacterized protein n=1 Tax=Microvirga splendida TaxID=2795727 RepID=A0ABS0Y002_9HYPH|nr:hypothetical protein [Microvirga splendida]MBJ6125636.1 hypothetical protein [Microvirga splendida]
MSDPSMESEHLDKAERHIVEGERRVAAQKTLIARLTEEGRDTALAEEFLQSLEQTLEQWHIHRRLILESLARE